MNSDYDVLIAGGGMVGATLACALGASALKIGVIENQIALPLPAGQARLQIAPQSVVALVQKLRG